MKPHPVVCWPWIDESVAYIRSLGGQSYKVSCVKCGADVIAARSTHEAIRDGEMYPVCLSCVPDGASFSMTPDQMKEMRELDRAEAQRN